MQVDPTPPALDFPEVNFVQKRRDDDEDDLKRLEMGLKVQSVLPCCEVASHSLTTQIQHNWVEASFNTSMCSKGIQSCSIFMHRNCHLF